MRIQYSPPMQKQITPDIERKLRRALEEFPEFNGHMITVGLNRSRGLHGSADGDTMTIRVNPRRRVGVTYFTIGHELTHLLQKPGLGLVPNGEIQCDIFTLARSALFLDDKPTYLGKLDCDSRSWEHHASAVRQLCRRAVEVRKTNRRYIVWLQGALAEYFSQANTLDLARR